MADGDVLKIESGEQVWGPLPIADNITALAITVTDPPTQAEVQSIADKVDALIAALVSSGLMAAP